MNIKSNWYSSHIIVKKTKRGPEKWGSELTQLMNSRNSSQYTKAVAFLGNRLREDTGQNIQITTAGDYM